MQNELEYQDNELHGLYEKYKYKSWVAYLYLLGYGGIALHRFYIGDSFSKKLAIWLLVIKVILIILSIFLKSSLFSNIDLIIFVVLNIFDLFYIPKLVRNRNFELLKNINQLSDIQFQNRQLFWNYFSVVLLILMIVLSLHPIFENGSWRILLDFYT